MKQCKSRGERRMNFQEKPLSHISSKASVLDDHRIQTDEEEWPDTVSQLNHLRPLKRKKSKKLRKPVSTTKQP